MLLTKIKRIIKSGAISFWRNGSVSLASVLIMTVTLTVISMIVFSGVVLSSTLDTIKNKVDINVYFVKTASGGSDSSCDSRGAKDTRSCRCKVYITERCI